MLKHLGVIVALGHNAQESAANSVREIELVWTAGQDKCFEDGAHLELQLGELVGLRLVQVLGSVDVEVEHGNSLLDRQIERLGAELFVEEKEIGDKRLASVDQIG